MTTATAMTQTSPANQMLAILQSDKFQAQLKKNLPTHVGAERWTRLAMTCIRKTPKLVQCNPQSVYSAMFELAALGLEPSTPLGHAWILPYKGVAQPIIGYKGLMDLAWRSGKILIWASEVCQRDSFDFGFGGGAPGGATQCVNGWFVHRPLRSADRGELVAAYAIATLEDGRQMFDVIDEADARRAMKSSAAGNRPGSPWHDHREAMWMKTAVKRLSTFLPMATELVGAVAAEDAHEYQAIEIDVNEANLAAAADPVESLEQRMHTPPAEAPAKPKRRGRPRKKAEPQPQPPADAPITAEEAEAIRQRENEERLAAQAAQPMTAEEAEAVRRQEAAEYERMLAEKRGDVTYTPTPQGTAGTPEGIFE